MSCHVSNRHGQCEDERKLDYSFKVAINGPLGYEFNILKADQKIKDIISGQIKEYKNYEELILNGDFYRLKDPSTDGCYAYYVVNGDKTEIFVSYLQNEGDAKGKTHKLKISAARADMNYKDLDTNEVISGAELRRGIIVVADGEERCGKTWHFIAE